MSTHLRSLRSRLPKVIALTALSLLCSSGMAYATTTPTQTPPPEFNCTQGEFCGWSGEFYGGGIQRLDLRTANPDECIPLAEGFEAMSFANRTDRYVTIYQGADCSTEGDFSTYPGNGTFVPQGPYVVRAIQLWD
ncbi:hypothetical protein CFN78_18870 [Amycolatopsis antarctica]|uniref:Peptidase inhibitor n=1 Tax=Amycolatopsis antarctica TaxID=1854586 RepID=A0A263CZJ6_9PSEU|nr:peptidase inhibitor family I36 protein [Amycolatopsis antarctica]OZM71592.1 hypothetical protein CFN78_18870 [Amycolatopsis antarctica]